MLNEDSDTVTQNAWASKIKHAENLQEEITQNKLEATKY
jgi:hypothetical protein